MRTLLLSTILVLSATAHARLDGSLTSDQHTRLSASVNLYLNGRLFGGDETLGRELKELGAGLVFRSRAGKTLSRDEARVELAANGLVTYVCILPKNTFLTRNTMPWTGCKNDLNLIQLANPNHLVYGIDNTQPVGQRTFLPSVAQ